MPSKKIEVRHSELRSFRVCPLMHKFEWRDLWAPEEDSIKAGIGVVWHAMMTAHYNEIKRQQTAFLRHHDKLLGWRLDPVPVEDLAWAAMEQYNPDDPTILEWMYEGYREQWGFDSNWLVLYVEEVQSVPFREPSGRPSRYRYMWKSDLVVRDLSMRGRVLVVDHKSTSQPLRQTDVDLDDQFGLYVMGWLRKGLDVLAPVCNQVMAKRLVREMTLQERNARLYSYRTDVELHNIEQDALATAKAIYSKPNREYPYSAPDPRQCSWRCSYKEAHMALRKSKDPDQDLEHIMRSRGMVKRNSVPH